MIRGQVATKQSLGLKLIMFYWLGSYYQYNEQFLNLFFPFFFNRDISHNKISTLEEGIFDNLFNLSEM